MSTYSITSTGTPNYPLTISIAAPINVSHTYIADAVNSQEIDTPAFNNIMEIASNAVENAYKTLQEFSIQDASRNQTWTYTANGQDAFGQNQYKLITSYTITNAIVNLTTQTNSDLTGEELDVFLQSIADNAVIAYKVGWGWVDL
jgi:hypothetical protein